MRTYETVHTHNSLIGRVALPLGPPLSLSLRRSPNAAAAKYEMIKYEMSHMLSEGTFAVVYEARAKKDGARVAIKRIKERQRSWEGCLAMRELRSLKSMGKHANIVSLRELILEKDYLHFVFDFWPRNLHQLIKSASTSGGLSDGRVAQMAAGLLAGVARKC